MPARSAISLVVLCYVVLVVGGCNESLGSRCVLGARDREWSVETDEVVMLEDEDNAVEVVRYSG